MTVAVASDTSELLAEMRALCARSPVPQPSWHPYVSQIAACRADFERLAALLEGDDEPVFGEGGAACLAASGATPRPSGQHPYLDETIPALDGLRLLLAALNTADTP